MMDDKFWVKIRMFFMVFPVCQNKIKECMEFLCLSKYHDDFFIKECVEFYNSMINFGLK